MIGYYYIILQNLVTIQKKITVRQYWFFHVALKTTLAAVDTQVETIK